jgi:hypothetical protein
MRHTLTLLLLTVIFPAAAAAEPDAAKPAVPHNQILSTNPFGLMLNWVNGEYERKASVTTTLGLSASYIRDEADGNVAAFARWYPHGAALDGFYLGARIGAFRFTTAEYDYTTPSPLPSRTGAPPYYPVPTIHRRVRVRPGAGLELGYNWLLGARRNVTIGAGFGLSRIVGGTGNYDMPDVLPNIRLVNIGFAF